MGCYGRWAMIVACFAALWAAGCGGATGGPGTDADAEGLGEGDGGGGVPDGDGDGDAVLEADEDGAADTPCTGPWEILCGTACIDPSADPLNCGG